jgi:hypothetical protein
MKNPGIEERHPPLQPPGQRTAPGHAALAVGARVLQDMPPVRTFDVYVVGFHCAREDPKMQMEAHHYCKQVNDDLLQCVIFDGNTADANLIGIEYIISERLHSTLAPDEQALWHPHNYEIFSGTLVAPGLPEAAERALMAHLVNSYGKTWHTWHTGRHDIGGGQPLPVGEAMLMWSFNRDGECDPALEGDRERVMETDAAERRVRRRSLLARAHPQHGVDTLRSAFPGSTPVEGVQDAGTAPDR